MQVPDIYDAAKYDAIHNAHLGVDLKELYQVGHSTLLHVYLLVRTMRLLVGA